MLQGTPRKFPKFHGYSFENGYYYNVEFLTGSNYSQKETQNPNAIEEQETLLHFWHSLKKH